MLISQLFSWDFPRPYSGVLRLGALSLIVWWWNLSKFAALTSLHCANVYWRRANTEQQGETSIRRNKPKKLLVLESTMLDTVDQQWKTLTSWFSAFKFLTPKLLLNLGISIIRECKASHNKQSRRDTHKQFSTNFHPFCARANFMPSRRVWVAWRNSSLHQKNCANFSPVSGGRKFVSPREARPGPRIYKKIDS